jgi:hypothetical protein
VQILTALRQADKAAHLGRGQLPSYTAGAGDGWDLTGPCHKQRLLSIQLGQPEANAALLAARDKSVSERGDARDQTGRSGAPPTFSSRTVCCIQLLGRALLKAFLQYKCKFNGGGRKNR